MPGPCRSTRRRPSSGDSRNARGDRILGGTAEPGSQSVAGPSTAIWPSPAVSMGSLAVNSPAVPIMLSLLARPPARKQSSLTVPHAGENGGFTTAKKGPLIADIPLEYIRRPLLRTRNNDPEKVKQLMESIAEIGLQVPIDVLEVEGEYYGFSGCHRYEAHQKLGLPTIKCKIRRGTRETLRHHLR